MGSEFRCRVQHQGQAGEGTALLESTELMFRGDIRFRIPLASITKVETTGGRLLLTTAGGLTALELGEKAALWAEKIRNPKSLLDKWGLRSGQRVGLVGWSEAELPGSVAGRGLELVAGRSLKACDLILWNLTKAAELERLPRLRAALVPTGGIWCVYPKGNRAFGEEQVRRAARANSMVDVKVAAVSATHSSLKLVIPKDAR